MRFLSFTAVALVLLASCGDPSGPVPGTPVVRAINGAALPELHPGSRVALQGDGFGADVGQVLVPVPGGEAAAMVVAWGSSIVEFVVPPDVTNGSITVVTAAGLALEPFPIRAAAIDTVSTENRAWAAGAALPHAFRSVAGAGLVFGDTAAAFRALVIVAGGEFADGTLTDSTWIGVTDASGMITNWVSAPDTVAPIARRLHTVVGATALTSRRAADGVVWMFGGVDAAGRVLADVHGIEIGSDRSYGFWTPLAPLPRGRAGAAVAVGLGSVYVVGGFGADSIALRSVHVATITESGTLNGWFVAPPLPEGLAFAAAVVVDDLLLVAGGQAGLVIPGTTPAPADLRATVLALRLSPRSGFAVDTAWTVLPASLSYPRAGHALYVSGSALIAAGGFRSDSAETSETEWAPLSSNGTLGAFAARVAAGVPGTGAPLFGFAAPALRDGTGRAIVTILGGVTRDGSGSDRAWWH